MTQESTIHAHLKIYGYITPMEAFHKYNITDLAGRIRDLRADGVDIQTDTLVSDNKKRYACYRLIKEKQLTIVGF